MTGKDNIGVWDTGVFFMSLEEYLESFETTTFNLDTENMYQDSFTMFSDQMYEKANPAESA